MNFQQRQKIRCCKLQVIYGRLSCSKCTFLPSFGMIFPCHCWTDLTTFYGNYEDTLVLIQYSLLLHRSIILYEFITFLFCQTLVKHVLLTLCHLGKITISAIYHNTTRETEPVKMIFDLKREIMSLINASRLGLW